MNFQAYSGVVFCERGDLSLVGFHILQQVFPELWLYLQQNALYFGHLFMQLVPHVPQCVHPLYVFLRNLDAMLLKEVVAFLQEVTTN